MNKYFILSGLILLSTITLLAPDLFAQTQWQPKLDLSGVSTQAATAGANWKAIISWGIEGALVLALLASVHALGQNKPNAKELVIGFLLALVVYNIGWMLI